MKLLMPKILYPALNAPLDATITIEIDYTEHQEFVEMLISKGWIEDECSEE